MVDDERYARVAGLESFFTRLAQPGPRWRLTLLTVAAVFAITSLLQQFVMPHLASWPLELRLLLSAVVVVLLLGHVVMPALTRVFAALAASVPRLSRLAGVAAPGRPPTVGHGRRHAPACPASATPAPGRWPCAGPGSGCTPTTRAAEFARFVAVGVLTTARLLRRYSCRCAPPASSRPTWSGPCCRRCSRTNCTGG